MMGELVAFGNPELMAGNYCGACNPALDKLDDVAEFAKRFAVDRTPRATPRLIDPIRRIQRTPNDPGPMGCGEAFRKFGRQQATAWALVWLSTSALFWALIGLAIARGQVRREMPEWAIFLSIFCGVTTVSFLSVILTCWVRGI